MGRKSESNKARRGMLQETKLLRRINKAVEENTPIQIKYIRIKAQGG